MKQFFWLLFLLLVVVGCKNSPSPDEATISGVISGAAGQSIFLEELSVNDLVKIDSSEIGKDNIFTISYLPNEPGFFLLKLKSGDFVTLILDKGDRIEILSDTSTFPQGYEISGNEDSKILQNYFTGTAINQGRLDSMSRIFNSSIQLPDFYKIKLELDSVFANLFSNQQQFAHQIVYEHPNSLASLLLINQRFGNKKLFNENDDFELMVMVDSCLMKAYPGNSHVVAHHNRVEGILEKHKQQQEAEARLAPGQIAPSLKLPDPTGKIVSLESLQGKWVVLYFWSSFSPPCRAANIQLKEIYAEYKAKGLEIYAVSFDQNKNIWSDVIKMENLDWINVSGVFGTTSLVKKLYNLPEELPYLFLIDREGKILAKSKSVSEVKLLIENIGSKY